MHRTKRHFDWEAGVQGGRDFKAPNHVENPVDISFLSLLMIREEPLDTRGSGDGGDSVLVLSLKDASE